MIDSLGIAAGTAFVTIIGTRWVDNRRHLAQERGLLATELRVQLAEAHRRANACVRALNVAMDASASFAGDRPTGEFLDAINQFQKAPDHLRSQTSELLVRSDPTVQPGLSEPMTTMLKSAERLLCWMRYGEVPHDWENHEELFLQREVEVVEMQPWLLIQVGAPQASPAALGPWLEAVLRRGTRRERRELRRQNFRILVGRFTGRNRREKQAAKERMEAAQARIELSKDEGTDAKLAAMKFDEKTFYNACILTVRVETNVPQGGDAGHGGITRLMLRDEGSFAFGEHHVDPLSDGTATIEVLGDIEAHVLADALLWAGEHLKAMTAAAHSRPVI